MSNSAEKLETLPVATETLPPTAEGAKGKIQNWTLIGCTTGMAKALHRMHDINTKANVIALNAAIEGARSQTHSENFTLVANQVKRQAQRTEDLAKELKDQIDHLQTWALKSTAVRFADIASDVIDKIDRNLFERNCDCQAWAGFEESVACARSTKGLTKLTPPAEDELDDNEVTTKINIACEMLGRLVEIYQVYTDAYITNNKGIIVAAAVNRKLIGKDVNHKEYFQKVSQSGSVYVTDMFESDLTGTFTVAYSAPIADESGNFMGVLSTRFNWEFAQEIIDKMPLTEEARISVINKKGTVIASTFGAGIMQDNLAWLTAGESAIRGGSGYTIECARNGRQSSFGYCRTRGFNAYPGKDWSAIVSHPIDPVENPFLSIPISRDGVSHLRASQNCNLSLVKVANSVRQCVTSINSINNETNMLAINAAIQAGVAGAEGESFSVIASEIGNMARQSEEFVQIVNNLTQELGTCVHKTVAVRLGDAAFDTMDKVDRNLFERNCDIQAFTLFKPIIASAEAGQTSSETNALLSRIFTIYEVYHDIFLLDVQGNVIGAAERKDLVGTNQHDREWFREAVRGNLVVTDLYYSKSIDDYTVTFAMPVLGSKKNVCGVITTRFNCKTIYDICQAAIVGDDCKVYMVNSKGMVIGSPDRRDLLNRSFVNLESFRLAQTNRNGFVEERDPEDKVLYSTGYSHSSGYNNFKGKGWSVIIRRPSGE